MKTVAITLAVLTVSGTAMAQSNVTLYGRIDTSIGKQEIVNPFNPAADVNKTEMGSGRLTPSRFGIRGSEDLGGGMSANFNLEGGLRSDTGSAMSFDRHSWVGLSGGFGAIKLGKTDSAYKDIFDLGNTQAVFDSDFTPSATVFKWGVENHNSVHGGRPANQIRYETPDFNGISAVFTTHLQEKQVDALYGQSLNVRYKAGGLNVGVAVQSQKREDTEAKLEHTVIGGAYDFGSFKISGQYQTGDLGFAGTSIAKDKEYGVGISVPMGNIELSAAYAANSSKLVGLQWLKGDGFGLGATYALSKRTKLYAGWTSSSVDSHLLVPASKLVDNTVYAVGVRHDF
jgi:predicted porin